MTSEVAPRGRIRVTFRDNGPGIPPDRLPHVFEPFGSNSSPTVGTGLGLFSCHNVIARHGGSIRAGAGEGGGSLFEVLLPALMEGANVVTHDSDGRACCSRAGLDDDSRRIPDKVDRPAVGIDQRLHIAFDHVGMRFVDAERLARATR